MNRTAKLIAFASILAMGLQAPAKATATDIALGKSVTGTGYYDSGSEVFPYANITNGELNDTGSPSNWSFWLTPQGEGGTATIDLGSTYDITSLYVQNTLNRVYHDREAGQVNFYVSSTAPTFGDVGSYGSEVNSTLFPNTESTGLIADTTFDTNTVGRYVTIDITSFYGASGGLNEVEVFGTSAVPEPATWAMMLAGMGMVGFAMRRRAKVAVSYA